MKKILLIVMVISFTHCTKTKPAKEAPLPPPPPPVAMTIEEPPPPPPPVEKKN